MSTSILHHSPEAIGKGEPVVAGAKARRVPFCYNASRRGDGLMRIFEKLQPLSLLVLRLALGVIFFYHGYERLAQRSRDVLDAFVGAGLPAYLYYVIGTLELFGAILLVLGLLTRITSLLLAIELGFLLFRVNIPRAGIYSIHSYELPLALFAGAFALATTGAGLLSLDAATFERGKSRSKVKTT